ncbi:MAG: VanZ family protein [Myxococcota bacterium]
MRSLAIAMAALVVGLTLFANLGDGTAFRFVRHIPGRDLTGHFVLFGLLAFLSISSIERPVPREGRVARIRWALALSALVALEEGSQAFIPSRSFSLWDLSASWAGIFVGFLGSILWVRWRSAGTHSSSTP